jgi:hypothetical protein
MNRRQFIKTAAASVAASSALLAPRRAAAQSRPAATGPAASQPVIPDDLRWHSVRDWGVEGRAFDGTEAYFDRLPARARGKVPAEVWTLSKQTSGMIAHFDADTTDVYIRYRLTSDRLAMPHMPATGVSGVDCYARPADDGPPHGWRWLAIRRPGGRDVAGPLAIGMFPGRRQYQLHLPLFNGIESLEVGVPKGAPFHPVAPRRERPVLFYGTSIMHGMSASRPGMGIPNILGRRLNRPVLNFGFAGSGKMEIEVAQLLDEVGPAVFVLDCVPNCEPDEISSRAEPLVKLWRASHPDAPILMAEDRTFTHAAVIRKRREENVGRRAAYRRAFENLRQAGVGNLHYLAGNDFLGHDGEATIDGSHPTDLGMVRYADAYEPVLRDLLQ